LINTRVVNAERKSSRSRNPMAERRRKGSLASSAKLLGVIKLGPEDRRDEEGEIEIGPIFWDAYLRCGKAGYPQF
jgi:hypothetical protein